MINKIKAVKAELMLLTMTMIWGATFTFTDLGLNFASPILYLILRFAVAVLLCLIFFNKILLNMDSKMVKHGIILGLLFGGGFIFQTSGINHTSVSNSAFITGLTVSIVPFAFWILSKKKVLLFSKIGVVVASIGLVIFTNPAVNEINFGDMLTLISIIFWAVYITLMDKYTKHHKLLSETKQMAFMQMITSLLLFLIVFFITEFPNHKLIFNNDLILSFLFNGAIASFILLLVHTRFQKDTTPVKAALIFSLEPIFAAIIAYIFIDEILNNRELLGASILMFGVLLSELGQPFLDLFARKKLNT